MQEIKNWLFLIGIFVVWTITIFTVLWLNTENLVEEITYQQYVISYVFIWFLGFLIFLPFIVKIHNQNLAIENLKENQKSFLDIYNFFNNPAFLIDKKTSQILKLNDVAITHFNIDPNDINVSNDSFDCILNGIELYKDSIIRNMKLENSCYDDEGKEFVFEIFLHDLFLNDRFVTLAVLNDKTETDDEKSIKEMSEYIEDLHAKEDVLEDNAFELIQLTIKLEESENNLKEANANKDKFFSIVAHDLKSPFVGLLGITEMLDSDYDDFEEKERREFIHSLYEISKNTFELLEGLLEWARAKQGRMEFSPKEFDFFKLTDSLTNLLKANAFKKEIKLINSVDINSLVYGDRDMISTVLRNLLANAIKFTPQNGIVEVKAEIENKLLKVTVEDSGIGMTQQSQEKLFRIDVNHTTLGTNQEKGTGLGLILCKELIDNHKTEIWVESELGIGSKFIFTLPKRNIFENNN